MEDAMSNMKAAALIGLSLAVTGVSAANAATTSVTQMFSLSVAPFADRTEPLPFAQFNPSLGTLTDAIFSLTSAVSAAAPGSVIPVAQLGEVAVPSGDSANLATSGLEFDFTNISGIVSPVTTADFTGSGTIKALLTIFNDRGSVTATWTANQPGQGLTLTYDYTPATSATPLPAALPLFATGLGALGLLGWRRKRKARASLWRIGLADSCPYPG
jgi:hypothetical protein